ncbi:MAG: hypothetical protein OEM82_06840 [Acidobacteriota bacterium]|nr:hypothetical protein [Acidobacteriota bacterium]MDH3529325.1 hypothetical protein [Acidobacteriota bacterium]
MLGTSEELKAIGIGSLETMGLGRIAPFVKLGLDSMGGNRTHLEDEVRGLLSRFDMHFAARASKLPPLGRFQSSSSGMTPLSPGRLTELLKEFNGLIGKSGGPNVERPFDALRKVFATVDLLYRTFRDQSKFSDHAAGSAFSKLRI